MHISIRSGILRVFGNLSSRLSSAGILERLCLKLNATRRLLLTQGRKWQILHPLRARLLLCLPCRALQLPNRYGLVEVVPLVVHVVVRNFPLPVIWLVIRLDCGVVLLPGVERGDLAHLIPRLLPHQLHGIADRTAWPLLVDGGVVGLVVEVALILLNLGRGSKILESVRIVTAITGIRGLNCFSCRFHAGEARLYHVHL